MQTEPKPEPRRSLAEAQVDPKQSLVLTQAEPSKKQEILGQQHQGRTQTDTRAAGRFRHKKHSETLTESRQNPGRYSGVRQKPRQNRQKPRQKRQKPMQKP
jgi:hypothetical protein